MEIIIKAIKLNDNTIVPIWDENIIFKKDVYGVVCVEYKNYDFYQVIECNYNIITKEINLGINVDDYLNNFYNNEYVFCNLNDIIIKTKIIDVKYNNPELLLIKGCDLNNDNKETLRYNFLIPDENLIYCFRIFKPIYVLETGDEVSEYKIYKIGI